MAPSERSHACGSCKSMFGSALGLSEHARQSHPQSQLYCDPCRKTFQSQANLNAVSLPFLPLSAWLIPSRSQHLNSSKHKPAIVPCPMLRCTKKLISTTALILHFESDSCISGMTSSDLDYYVLAWDKNHFITQKRIGPASCTPPTTYTATNQAWNPSTGVFECPMCPRDFKNLASLNQHLASPVHTSLGDNMYHCPNGDCGKGTRTFGALSQHIADGTCGAGNLREVEQAMDALVGGMRSIAFCGGFGSWFTESRSWECSWISTFSSSRPAENNEMELRDSDLFDGPRGLYNLDSPGSIGFLFFNRLFSSFQSGWHREARETGATSERFVPSPCRSQVNSAPRDGSCAPTTMSTATSDASATPSSPPELPLLTDLSHCSPPVRKIFTDEDIPAWLSSKAYSYIETLIQRLSIAVEEKKVEDACLESPVRRHRCGGRRREEAGS